MYNKTSFYENKWEAKFNMANEIATIIPNAFTITSEEYYQLESELEALSIILQSDHVANYRVTMELTPHVKSGKIKERSIPPVKRVSLTAFINPREGCLPAEFNKRQTRALTGVEHPVLNAKGKVDARWALDRLATEFGMAWEELVNHIENIAMIKKRIKKLEVKLAQVVVTSESANVQDDGLGEELQ
jgi:hypothetical protein